MMICYGSAKVKLCVGWAIKMDAEGAKTMDLMGIVFGSRP